MADQISAEGPSVTGLSASKAWRWWPWLSVLAAFVVTRVFTGHLYYKVGGDQCTYLEMARTFPRHHVFGGMFYLIHPPLFGWSIGLLALALPLVTAGLVANHLYWLGAFFAVKRYARASGLGLAGTVAALLLLTVDWLCWWHGIHVSRFGMLVGGIGAAVVAFELYLSPAGCSWWLALAATAFCMLGSAPAQLALACQLIAWIASRRWDLWKPVLRLWVVSVLLSLIWIGIKLAVYHSHQTYPAGIDGTIEPVGQSGFMSLLQPNLFPNTSAHNRLYDVGTLGWSSAKLARLDAATAIWPPISWSGWAWVAFLGLALWPKDQRRSALKFLAMAVVLMIPALIGQAWYSIAWLIPGCMIAGLGINTLVRSVRHAWSDRITSAVLALSSLALAMGWLRSGTSDPVKSSVMISPGAHCAYTLPAIARGQPFITDAISKLPPRGMIMAPVGFSPEVLWATGRNIVALPFDPSSLDGLIDAYDVRHIVLAESYLKEATGNPKVDRLMSRTIVKYIAAHPEKYTYVAAGTDVFGEHFVIVATPRAARP